MLVRHHRCVRCARRSRATHHDKCSGPHRRRASQTYYQTSINFGTSVYTFRTVDLRFAPTNTDLIWAHCDTNGQLALAYHGKNHK